MTCRARDREELRPPVKWGYGGEKEGPRPWRGSPEPRGCSDGEGTERRARDRRNRAGPEEAAMAMVGGRRGASGRDEWLGEA